MLLLTAVMLNGCKADSTAERPAADSVTALDSVAQTGDNKAEDKKAEESAVKESATKKNTAEETAVANQRESPPGSRRKQKKELL
mgnify:CR=1 FL=1